MIFNLNEIKRRARINPAKLCPKCQRIVREIYAKTPYALAIAEKGFNRLCDDCKSKVREKGQEITQDTGQTGA